MIQYSTRCRGVPIFIVQDKIRSLPGTILLKRTMQAHKASHWKSHSKQQQYPKHFQKPRTSARSPRGCNLVDGPKRSSGARKRARAARECINYKCGGDRKREKGARARARTLPAGGAWASCAPCLTLRSVHAPRRRAITSPAGRPLADALGLTMSTSVLRYFSADLVDTGVIGWIGVKWGFGVMEGVFFLFLSEQLLS